jgi:lysophospholipase L1-like esterase
MNYLFRFSVWLLFVFLLLQFAGWVYFSLNVAKPIEGYGYPAGLHVEHPVLDFLYQPGFSGYFNGAAFGDIPIEINERGFRDGPFPAAEPGRARLAFLGDSVVFGAGVRADERFTECLERGASDSPAPLLPTLEVLNLGVNSYTFGHYLGIAELDYFGLAPEAVVLGITLNDFAPMADASPARRLRRHAEALHKPDWVERVQDRLGRTYAGRFLGELEDRIQYALMNADAREEYHTKWMRSVVTAWQDPATQASFARELDRFLARASEDALPVGVVLFPELNDLLEPTRFGSARRIVLGILAERQVPICDLYQAFAQHDEPQALFLPHDGVHFTPAGHHLACAAIARCLNAWDAFAAALNRAVKTAAPSPTNKP